MRTFMAGDRVIWFDSRLWGGKDIGHNEHCDRPGIVLRTYADEVGRPLVDILFDHNPNISHGHFAYPPYGGKITAEGLKVSVPDGS